MKLAFFFLDAFAPGGYPRDVRWLAGALSAYGCEVSVLGRPGPESDGTGSAIQVTREQEWLREAREADVLHIFGFSNVAQLRAATRMRSVASAVVISPLAHLMSEHVRVSAWKKTPFYAFVGRTLSRKTHAHFFSRREEAESRRFLHPLGSFIAPAGVFPTATTPRLEGPGDHLLFFGRNDVHQKGLDLLVEGYERALARGLDLPLVIGGRAHGESEAFMREAMSRPALKGRLEWAGPASDDERERLMAGARTFVFLSRWDGPPRPVREAIALEVPVIVSGGTNMGDDVTDHGAGLEVRSTPDAIAAALLCTQDVDQIAAWRDGARRLKDDLSWERVASAYLAGYEAVLAR